MSDLKTTTTLPLLPLATGVVLPGMVVTIALESPDARAAVDASDQSGGRVVMVPRLEHGFARVGTVAKIEDRGELPSGIRVVVIRGIDRGVIGLGVAAPSGAATWVHVEPVEPTTPTPRAIELAREYRAVIENVLEHRGAPQMAELFRGITDPGAMADT
ncbi:MAG: LON peptidase substrate-binding domain-containing protein, partial [Pseudonocardiaceae bacterium]